MARPSKHPVSNPDLYLLDLFSSRIAREGGIVRRKSRDIMRYVGKERFEHELDRRGFRAFENSGHILIICNQDPINKIR